MIPLRCPKCLERIDGEKVVEWGGWSYDEASRVLNPGAIKMTSAYGNVIGALLRAGGRTVGKDNLISMIYGGRPECDVPHAKIIDVLVSKIRERLRRKMAREALIGTVWGVGYFAVPQEQTPFVRPGRGGRRKGKWL